VAAALMFSYQFSLVPDRTTSAGRFINTWGFHSASNKASGLNHGC
jgi:hypothetical protein